jgi:AcrR family transcriptional regulator
MARPRTTSTEHVIATAATLFLERGYHNTSIEDVAEAAGISKPTVYKYVESKQWLLDTIMLDKDGEDRVAVSGVRGEPPPLAGTSITIGVFHGWPEGIAATFLWKAALEERGAEVQIRFADVAAVYREVAEGELDLAFDAWLPSVHLDYWAEYGDRLEDLGAWYSGAGLAIAVNDDAPIHSLAEFADHADEFNNRLVGMIHGVVLLVYVAVTLGVFRFHGWRTGTLLVSRPGKRRNTELFLEHLDDLRRSLRSYTKIHVICDNAAFHQSRAVKQYLDRWRDRIEIHFLPKPFSLKQLAVKVKEVMAEPGSRVGPSGYGVFFFFTFWGGWFCCGAGPSPVGGGGGAV